MSGHTPGRWFWALDKDNQPTCLMRSGSGDYVLSPQVEMKDYGLSVHCWNDVSENDARLIATAPELLQALIELARKYEGVCDNLPYGYMGKSEINADLAPARIAIANASASMSGEA